MNNVHPLFKNALSAVNPARWQEEMDNEAGSTAFAHELADYYVTVYDEDGDVDDDASGIRKNTTYASLQESLSFWHKDMGYRWKIERQEECLACHGKDKQCWLCGPAIPEKETEYPLISNIP